MKRDYDNGVQTNIDFFVGTEVEHTPAFGLRTLFVVGIQPVEKILNYCQERMCQHIYLGANQSFQPDVQTTEHWDAMIRNVLKFGHITTLDFDVEYIEWVADGLYCENDLFIPQISVKIPYIRQLNYNATLKIDDRNFKSTNPGVWCHRIHDLQDINKFTSWNEYTKDQPI